MIHPVPLESEILNLVREHHEIDHPGLVKLIRPKGWSPRRVRTVAQEMERAGQLYRKVCFQDMRRVISVMPPEVRV